MQYRRPRGVNDITPAEVGRWQYAETLYRDLCRRFAYQEIRTPLFEQTELFIRAIGEETDLVNKEMYTFQDRNGRNLTLRAEGTAPVVRAFLEDNLQGQDRERLVKLFYVAPIFRYERPQAGRYRQHHQAGAEALGSSNPALDAEIIALAVDFYRGLGITDLTLLLNSVGCPVCRPRYLQQLKAAVEPQLGKMCEDCQRRFATNPLRLLDCKRDTCREVTASAPKITDLLCDDCGTHFEEVQNTLRAIGIDWFTLEPRLVRGLDYYTKTAFEFRAPGLGAQDSIGGGGRYDELVQEFGGPPTPAVGIGMGLERVLIAQEAAEVAANTGASSVQRAGVFVVALGDQAWEPALRLLYELRQAGQIAEVDYRRRSMRAQFSFADKEDFRWTAILGENELREDRVTLRNLETGEQESIKREKLAERISATRQIDQLPRLR